MLINSPNISGSLTVTGNSVITGSLTVLGGINGAITGSATTASYVEYTNVANKPTLVSGSSQVTYSGLTGIPSGIVSGSSQVTYSGLTGIPLGIVSGSAQVTYSGLTGVPSGIVSGSAQIVGYGIFATTGSNGFNGSQSITGSLTVTGQVVAQTLNVQQVTSSIVYSSGSNVFGNELGNTQQFTGSVSITGSLATSGTGTFSGALSLNSSANRVNSGNELRFYRTDNGIYTQLYDGGAANGFVLDNRNGDGFSFQTAGTNQLRIASTGAATFSGLNLSLNNTGATASDPLFTIQSLGGGNPRLKFLGQAGVINRGAVGDNLFFGETADTGQYIFRGTGAATFGSSVTAGTNIEANNGYLSISAGSGTAYSSRLSTVYSYPYIDTYLDSLAGASYDGRLNFRIQRNGGSVSNVMTILPTGNVGIGTTDPASLLSMNTSSATAYDATADDGQADSGSTLTIRNGNTTTNSFAQVNMQVSGDSGRALGRIVTIRMGSATSDMAFVTESDNTKAEKMRITSGGNVGIGTINPTRRLQVEAPALEYVFVSQNTRNASGDLNALLTLGNNANNTSSYFLVCSVPAGDRMYIYGNGNIVNTNGSYGTLSDISLKENIVDATPKLADLLQLKVRNFNLIGSEEKQIGFVAQEFEEIFPKMVDIDGKNGMKTIKTSVLVPMLVKAIQELKAENDTLKSRIDTLEQA